MAQEEQYSCQEQQFLDICRFGDNEEFSGFLSGISQDFNWQWRSATSTHWIHMLSANGLNELFDALLLELKGRLSHEDILALINTPNEDANSPLHYAVMGDAFSMVQKLVESGADTNLENCFHRTPLAEAQMLHYNEIAEFLAPRTKPDLKSLQGFVCDLEPCGQDDEESSEQQEPV